MERKGFILWITGLPASGKSTLARLAAEELRAFGWNVEVLDGDELRKGALCCDLGFSREDRGRNVERIGFVCGLLSRNGIVAIAAAVSPHREHRRKVRAAVENFVEVYAKCPLEVCIKRDPKGDYKKALAGEIPNFTGISDTYEEPENAEIVLETDKYSPEECVRQIMSRLVELGLVEPTAENGRCVYTKEEEEKVKKRLEDLGYI